MDSIDLKFSNEDAIKSALPGQFENCDMTGLKMASIPLRSSIFFECRFVNCNFAGANLVGSTFREARFVGCNLIGINWTLLNRFENCEFDDCKLDMCSFQGLKLKRLKLSDCSLKEADFSDALLTEADFSGCLLRGAVFTRADLSKSNLRSAKEYFIDPAFTKLKRAKVRLPEATSLLVAMGLDVDFG